MLCMLVHTYLLSLKPKQEASVKDSIEYLTKDWPGVSYLVLNRDSVVPWYRPLLAICYTYNARDVLSFVATEYASRTRADIPYLSK